MKLKAIGFSRYISRQWLHIVARTMCEQSDPNKVQGNLRELFENEPLGKEAKRKTLDVLTRIWIRIPNEHKEMRNRGLDLYRKVDSNERVWLHWGMSLNAYSIFRDIASLTGRLLSLQGEVATGQIKRGIVDKWGDRTTLTRSVDRIIQSMRDWGVLTRKDDEKIYTGSKKYKSDNLNLQLWLLEATFRAQETTVVALLSLIRHPALFPFKIDIPYSELIESNQFELSQQGLDNQVLRLR